VSLGTIVDKGARRPGSLFIDGLGSSEMGFSLFRAIHTPRTNVFNRCIGKPLEWVDATVLDDEGRKLPPYQIGKLGVKSPTITPGYWNDSLLTERTRMNGYWLTWDMFYYDEEKNFFHVDRIPDVIHTKKGPVYSLQTEELLMKFCPELADCTVVGVPEDGKEGLLVPIALVRLKKFVVSEPDNLAAKLNQVLSTHQRQTLARVIIATEQVIPLGPTGKVLKRDLREKYKGILAGNTSGGK